MWLGKSYIVLEIYGVFESRNPHFVTIYPGTSSKAKFFAKISIFHVFSDTFKVLRREKFERSGREEELERIFARFQ